MEQVTHFALVHIAQLHQNTDVGLFIVSDNRYLPYSHLSIAFVAYIPDDLFEIWIVNISKGVSENDDFLCRVQVECKSL